MIPLRCGPTQVLIPASLLDRRTCLTFATNSWGVTGIRPTSSVPLIRGSQTRWRRRGSSTSRPRHQVWGGLFNNYVGRARPEELLFHTNYIDVRVDQYHGDKDHFSASIYYQGAHPNTISRLPVQVSNDNNASPEYAFVDRFNWDRTLSPTLLNHLAMGYHNREEGYGSLNAKYADLFPQISGVATHEYPPVLNIGGYGQYGDNYGGPNIKNVTARPDFTINDLFTWVRGKHTIKIGG